MCNNGILFCLLQTWKCHRRRESNLYVINIFTITLKITQNVWWLEATNPKWEIVGKLCPEPFRSEGTSEHQPIGIPVQKPWLQATMLPANITFLCVLNVTKWIGRTQVEIPRDGEGFGLPSGSGDNDTGLDRFPLLTHTEYRTPAWPIREKRIRNSDRRRSRQVSYAHHSNFETKLIHTPLKCWQRFTLWPNTYRHWLRDVRNASADGWHVYRRRHSYNIHEGRKTRNSNDSR